MLSPFLIGQSNGNTASATGTITATKADDNIAIYGPGKLNGNFAGGTFTASGTYQDHAILLNNVNNPVISDVEFLDFRKYAICIANAVSPDISDISGHSGSDGVHIYGPCWSPRVKNVAGVFGDDAVVLQTIDGTLYSAYQPPNSGGSFYEGAQIENVNTDTTGNSGGVVIYPAGGNGSGDVGHSMFGTFEVDNVGHAASHRGSINPGSSFALGNGYVTDIGRIDQLVLRNVRGVIVLANAGANKVITLGTLLIDGQTTHALGENSVLRIDYMTIGQAVISGFDIYNPVSTGNKYIDLQSANINIASLIIKDGRLTNLGDGLKLIRGAGATVGKITVDNVIGNTGCTFINTDGVEFATALELTLINCPNAPSNAITIGGAQIANIYANNISCSSTLYNLYGSGAVAIKSDYVVTTIPPFINAQPATTLINPQRSKAIVRSAPTTGQTVTIAAGLTLGYCYTAHLIAPSGALAALTLALPADPINGEVIKITITKAITALTITGGTLLGVTSGSSSAAGFTREFTYSSNDSIWV